MQDAIEFQKNTYNSKHRQSAFLYAECAFAVYLYILKEIYICSLYPFGFRLKQPYYGLEADALWAWKVCAASVVLNMTEQ